MRFEFKPSFDRSIKTLHSPNKEEVKEAAGQLIDVLSKDRQIHQGLGLKRLMGDYWEVRKGIKPGFFSGGREIWSSLSLPGTTTILNGF